MYRLSPLVLVGLTAVAPVALVAPVFAQSVGINLATPQAGRVIPTEGEPRRGRVSVDTPNQRVIVRASDGSEEFIPLSRLGKIEYDEGAEVFRSSGELIIRGDGSNITPVTRSMEVGWQDFATTDEGLGQVRVMLLRTQENRGIFLVARNTQYVVNEIVFDPQQQRMVIQATAYLGVR